MRIGHTDGQHIQVQGVLIFQESLICQQSTGNAVLHCLAHLLPSHFVEWLYWLSELVLPWLGSFGKNLLYELWWSHVGCAIICSCNFESEIVIDLTVIGYIIFQIFEVLNDFVGILTGLVRLVECRWHSRGQLYVRDSIHVRRVSFAWNQDW